MTNTWLINARLNEDNSERQDKRYRTREDIIVIMESCCHFITEQFPNMNLEYKILGAHTHDRR